MPEWEEKSYVPSDFHRLISHWPRNLSGMYLISHNSQPFSFQKNANVQKCVK